ncbi:hypothetical protein HA402_015580 [Bradysia odoriphaga]|nr:hypothetical protein HA402_015580 [Bradysia odoriphaga]
MTKFELKQNSLSPVNQFVKSFTSFFHNLNSKFDNYACTSRIFKPAGLYIMVTTVYMFISNIVGFIRMMIERTEVISRNESNNLYELTKLTIFHVIPWLNFNVYDIQLVLQYCEVLGLYWMFKDFMQDNFTSLESLGNSFNLVQYPIRLLIAVVRCPFSENSSIEFALIAGQMLDMLLKIVDWSMLRCYVFNATK